MPKDPRCILITGANGFVGRHLIAHLLDPERGDAPARIVACVSPRHLGERAWPQAGLAGWGPQLGSDRIEIAALDVCDPESANGTLTRVRPDQVYHLAARASGADADRPAVHAVNVEGTRNVLEAAALLNPFPRVLLASTSYVYGNTDPDRPAREEDPIGPLWKFGPYVDSKMEMEAMARSYRGLTVTARAFAHTGAGQQANFAIPAFARQLARIEAGQSPPQLYVGNLEAKRDLLDVRDVVRAYVLLMELGEIGEAYNVALGRPLSMREILDRLRAQCRVETEVLVDPNRLRPADIACSTGDARKLRERTNWWPRFLLKETLAATLDYWRAQTE